ncbi:MAG: DUF5009 domain-containing protein [Bacteroides sp.]|nr:DUF5009 domain-containing protein [Bacteroides sp.]
MKTSRLLSLDVLRGITIAGMILVNNPGSWGSMYAPLQHAVWHGLTPTDLIFPFFMYIMGISTYISLCKYHFAYSPSTLGKIVRRTCLIFLIGLGLSWLSVSFATWHNLAAADLGGWERLGQSVSNLAHLRILGVMQRLALTYGAASLIALWVRHRYIPCLIIGILLGYFFLLFFGHGFDADSHNILAIVDQKILGPDHMFVEFGLDPEGVLSTLPSVAHVLIGFCCGKVLMDLKDNTQRMLRLFLIGAFLAFTGYLLSYGCPVNKKIWSPTYVLITCGMASTLLAVWIWIIDVKGKQTWCRPFEAFGVNPLFIYVFAGVLATMLQSTYLRIGDTSCSVTDCIYARWLEPLLGSYPASFVYALLFVSVTWLVGYILYRKRIYIKI